jgi:hypothetical protein
VAGRGFHGRRRGHGHTATLTAFATDGTYDPASASTLGDAAGHPDTALTLGDAQAFSEWLQPLTLGSALSFMLDVGNQFSGSGYPDQFTLFLLDPGTDLPLYATDDPGGLDAVLTLALTGGTLAPVPHAAQLGGGAVVQVAGVPEPPAWALWPMAALGGDCSEGPTLAAPSRPPPADASALTPSAPHGALPLGSRS